MRSVAVRWLLLMVVLLAPALPAAAETRVALVIGNSAYANTTPLANPLNDARLMSEALKATGFDVVEALDADKRKIDGALRSFTDKLTGADIALFYYAGHGLQVGAQNYLVPTDAKLERERDLEFEAVKLDFVLRQMEIDREGKTSIVMLDACRDNPLARSLARSMGTRSAGIGRGLAAAATGLGTFIAYATQPGNVALDGSGKNSPFTQALAKHMRVKGRNLPATMIEVRKDVVAATNGNQVPWDHSALTGDFFFMPGDGAGPGTVAAAPAGNAADMAALQARLAKLEAEAKARDTVPASPAPAPARPSAAQQADAAKLVDLRKRAADLEELVKSLQQKRAKHRFEEPTQPGGTSPLQKLNAEIEQRSADLDKLKREIAGLEGRPTAVANATPITPKPKPQKVSPDFEETDNVAIKGASIGISKAPSPLACRTACEADTRCVAFQHGKKVGNMGQCELFSTVEARSEDQSWRSGVKRAAQQKIALTGKITPTQRGFVTAGGQLLKGEVIKEAKADNIAGCLVTCFNTPGCVAAVHDPVYGPSCSVLRSVSETIPSGSATAIVHGDLVAK
jgi:uncharacterized caspase-like protein